MSDEGFYLKIRLFQGVTPEEIEAVRAAGIPRAVPDGHTFFRMGDPNGSLFVIRKGSVSVDRPGSEKSFAIATLRAGQTFGEMSFLDASRATATIRALGATEAIELPRAAFDEICAKYPALGGKVWRNVALDLKARLAEANRVIDHYMDIEQLLKENPAFRETYGQI